METSEVLTKAFEQFVKGKRKAPNKPNSIDYVSMVSFDVEQPTFLESKNVTTPRQAGGGNSGQKGSKGKGNGKINGHVNAQKTKKGKGDDSTKDTGKGGKGKSKGKGAGGKKGSGSSGKAGGRGRSNNKKK